MRATERVAVVGLLLALGCGEADCADPDVIQCVNGQMTLMFSAAVNVPETKRIEADVILPGSVTTPGGVIYAERVLRGDGRPSPEVRAIWWGLLDGRHIFQIVNNVGQAGLEFIGGRLGGLVLDCTEDIRISETTCTAVGSTASVTPRNVCKVEAK